jgi:hypothetical protein
MQNVKLFKALAAFQQECPVVHKGTQGYGYSYADLPEILKTINPLLKKHKLGFTQLVHGDSISTILFHESGETIETTTIIPQGVSLKGMNEFQVAGSAITYYRRYALSAMLGIVTDKDIDAAGQQTSTPKPKAQPKAKGITDKKVAQTQLSACLDLNELKKAWSMISSDLQKDADIVKLKDELKTKLK